MEKMDKAAAVKLGAATTAKLQELAKELGLELTVNGGKYDPTRGTYAPRVEFSIPGVGNAAIEKDLKLFGITGDQHTTFVSGNRTFQITGVNFRAKAYPINAKDLMDGKTYKFAARLVLASLGQA